MDDEDSGQLSRGLMLGGEDVLHGCKRQSHPTDT